MTHRLSLDRIAEAARIVDPVFLSSPQFVCEPLSEALGLRLLVKVQTLNPVRCFKGRGADYYAATLTDPARFRHRTVAVALCGGNLTPEQAEAWLR
jgi:threonine dehydratase